MMFLHDGMSAALWWALRLRQQRQVLVALQYEWQALADAPAQ